MVEHQVKRKKSKKDKKKKDRHRRSPIPDDAPASPLPDDENDEENFNDNVDRNYHQKRKAKYADDDEQPRSSRRRRSMDGEFHNGQTIDERRRDPALAEDHEANQNNGQDDKQDPARPNDTAGSPKPGGDDQALSESELESRRAALLAQLNDSMMDE